MLDLKHHRKDTEVPEADTTTRKQIIELLRTRGWDARELSQAIGASQREVETHLRHVARSVEAHGERLVTRPAQCRECEFRFSDRDRTSKPSRCPKCKSEHIAPPVFQIR